MDVKEKRHEAGNIVERIRAAINGHDLQALTRCFAPDYVNETPAHPGRSFRGQEQVRRNWQRIFDGIPDIGAEVIRSTGDAGTAWSEWDMSGTRLDGSPFRMRGVAIYGVADEQAAWCRFYLEPVDEGGDDINSATDHVVTGASGPTAHEEGSR